MNLVSPIAAAILVIGLLLWLRQVLSRKRLLGYNLSSKAAVNSIEHLESIPLSASHSAHFLRCGNQTFLVVLHPGGCTLLDRVALSGEGSQGSRQHSCAPVSS